MYGNIVKFAIITLKYINGMYDILTLSIGTFFTGLFYIVFWRTKSAQLINYIPSIWTSLGIFFTFLSIYLGLKNLDFSSNIDNGTISVLIENISPAFSTSMIGIIGAIITSVINRLTIAYSEKRDDDKLKVYTQRTPEQILWDINKGIREMNESVSSIEQNGENFHDNIVTDFQKALVDFQEQCKAQSELQEKRWKEQMEVMVDSVKLAINDIKLSNNKLLENFIGMATDKMDGLAKSMSEESCHRKSELELFLKKHEDSLTDYVSKFEGFTLEHFNKLSKLFNEDIVETVKTFAEGQLASSYHIVEGVNKKMDILLSQILCEIQKELSRISDEVAGNMESLLTSHANKTQSAIDSALENNRLVFKQVSTESHENIKSLVHIFEERYNQITGALETFYKEINTKSRELVDNYEEFTRKLLAQTDKSVDSICNGLDGSVQKISGNIVSIEKSIKENIEGLKGKVVIYHNDLTALYKQLLEGVAQDIRKVINMDDLTKLTKDYSEELRIGLNILKSNIDSITGSMSDITETLKYNSREYSEAIKTISDLNNILSETIVTLQKQNEMLSNIETRVHV